MTPPPSRRGVHAAQSSSPIAGEMVERRSPARWLLTHIAPIAGVLSILGVCVTFGSCLSLRPDRAEVEAKFGAVRGVLDVVTDRVTTLERRADARDVDTAWIKSALYELTKAARVSVPPPPNP